MSPVLDGRAGGRRSRAGRHRRRCSRSSTSTRFGDLLGDSAFGRAILVKSALLLVLLRPGRVQPPAHAARGCVERAGPARRPGEPGVRLRRAHPGRGRAAGRGARWSRGALVGYSPTAGGATHAARSRRTGTSGPARLEMTVDPARVGRQRDPPLPVRPPHAAPSTTGSKELTVSASLPAKRIGPLSLGARKTGPGHYTVRGRLPGPGRRLGARRRVARQRVRRLRRPRSRCRSGDARAHPPRAAGAAGGRPGCLGLALLASARPWPTWRRRCCWACR